MASIFRIHFSLYLKHLQYSTSATATGRLPFSMVDFMVESLGFSNQKAKTLCSKVGSSNFKKDPNLVVDFLKQKGLTTTQIRKLVSCMPELLKCNVEKTLVPKFNVLEDMGIFGTDLAEVVASNASILHRKLSIRVIPSINFIKLHVGSDEKVTKILKKSSAYRLMGADVVTRLEPNIGLLRKYGLSDKRIFNLLCHHGRIFVTDPKKFEDIIIKVTNELKLPVDSATFPDAVVTVASLSNENREAKFKIFKSYGWTDMEIMTMFKKLPRLFAYSDGNIRERLEFFMNELGFEPGRLTEFPYAMTYSMKGRILPRNTLLQGLRDRKIITDKMGILSAICTSEPIFLKKFVLPYEDKVPDICKAYTCRVKGTRASQKLDLDDQVSCTETDVTEL